MTDLYTAVKRGIEASIMVRARLDAGLVDRQTAIRQLSEIGLLTRPYAATDFLDRVTTTVIRPPWWKFWRKSYTIVIPDAGNDRHWRD